MTLNTWEAIINFPKYFCNMRNCSLQFHISLNKVCGFARKCQIEKVSQENDNYRRKWEKVSPGK